MGKIYFASDFHLGIPDINASHERERKIIRWIESIEQEAEALYILGDLFDFWFEYKRAVPKGFTRILGKLASLTDAGLPVYFFTGNHDAWMRDYFETELGIPVYHTAQSVEHHGKKFYLAHGDGLGPGDKGYKRLKKVFRNSFSKWLFARIHPNLGIRIAQSWSNSSREAQSAPVFEAKEKEWLYHYANQKNTTHRHDFFIFGHRHLPLDIELDDGKSRYINLGDWMRHFTYAEFDGTVLALKTFDEAP